MYATSKVSDIEQYTYENKLQFYVQEWRETRNLLKNFTTGLPSAGPGAWAWAQDAPSILSVVARHNQRPDSSLVFSRTHFSSSSMVFLYLFHICPKLFSVSPPPPPHPFVHHFVYLLRQCGTKIADVRPALPSGSFSVLTVSFYRASARLPPNQLVNYVTPHHLKQAEPRIDIGWVLQFLHLVARALSEPHLPSSLLS